MAESTTSEESITQSQRAAAHTSFMEQLHAWQKVCNIHYALCWQNYHFQCFRHHASTNQTPAPRTTNYPTRTVQNENTALTREFIDFLILLVCKTFVLLFYRHITNTQLEITYRFMFSDNYLNEEVTMEDLRTLMFMELFYRFVACVYEAKFISAYGATPGKLVAGIKVVSCRASLSINRGGRHLVLVTPGSGLGAASSWTRSLVKNFSITFVIPVFLSMLFYQHNRATYDFVAQSIVVKDE